MPLDETVSASDIGHTAAHNAIHAAINDLEDLAGSISDVETTSGSQGKVDTHALDTTSVHGISDTVQLPAKNAAGTWTAEQRFPSILVKEYPTDVRHPDFGGVDLTGTTDSSAAIQAAVSNSPKPIFFPQGTIKFQNITFADPNYRMFQGAGWSRTHLQVASAGQSLFSISGNNHDGTVFQDMCFEGSTGHYGTGYETPNATERAFNCTGSADNFQPYFYRCAFTNLNNAIYLDPSAGGSGTGFTHSYFERCEFNNAPLRLVSAHDKNALKFIGCRWSGIKFNSPATEIRNTAAIDVPTQFYACTWESCDRSAVVLHNQASVVFDGCYFEFVNYDAAAPAARGGGTPWIDLQASTNHVSIRDCYMHDLTQAEVLIGSSTSPTGPFYGIMIDHLALGTADGVVQREKFADLIELHHPVTAKSEFRQDVLFTQDTDATRVEANESTLSHYKTTDTYPRYQLSRNAGGTDLPGLLLGSGSATPSTKLYRNASGQLETSNELSITNALVLGAAGYLFMTAASTSGTIRWYSQVTGDSDYRFVVSAGGALQWGPGNAARDVDLSRSQANVLALGSDDCLKTGAAVTGSRPTAATVGAGAQFYDTTLSKPIWSNGSVWLDATGAAV